MSWQIPDLGEAAFFDRMAAEGRPWLTRLRGCLQDPVHHAEGDAFVHTGLVCKALVELPAFQAASDGDQQILAWAALLHDIAKPNCHVVDSDGRISSPGHALKGSFQARRILWELDCPFEIREEIVGLVAHHMTPTWILNRTNPELLVRKISLDCRCRHLAILVEADILGRICTDQNDLLERLELFRELVRELEVEDQPAHFASPTARYLYFQETWHLPDQAPFEDFRCRVVMLSGMPGSGKDTWISHNAKDWPVISLDALRERMGVSPTDNQGAVIDAARELARGYLRRRENFVWNATNISAQMRQKPLGLFFEYNAHVTIVYLEAPRDRLLSQNRNRDAVVPAAVMERLLHKWEIPRLTESHQVEYVAQAVLQKHR